MQPDEPILLRETPEYHERLKQIK